MFGAALVVVAAASAAGCYHTATALKERVEPVPPPVVDADAPDPPADEPLPAAPGVSDRERAGLVTITEGDAADGGGEMRFVAFPQSVEEERARRARRRNRGLIFGAAELMGGVGVTALAFATLANPQPSESGSVPGRLGDSAQQIGGALLLAALGGSLALGGLGDLAMSAAESVLPSPLIRRDRGRAQLVGPDTVQAPPTRTLQATGSLSNILNARGPEAQIAGGLFQWWSPRVRARYELAAVYGAQWDGDRMLGGAGSVTVDFAFGQRRHFGRYPGRALTIHGGGGVAVPVDTGGAMPTWRAGLGYTNTNTLGSSSLLIGASQIVGVDDRPRPEMIVRIEVLTD